ATPMSISGRAMLDRRTIHVPDVASAIASDFPDSREAHQQLKQRSQVATPLLSKAESIGIMSLHRSDLHPFTDRQVALLETFADQAVIAIENARLFEALQEANQQLAEASQHKSQFLANMSH